MVQPRKGSSGGRDKQQVTPELEIAWARVISRAVDDPTFAEQLKCDPSAALVALGVDVPEDVDPAQDLSPTLEEAIPAIERYRTEMAAQTREAFARVQAAGFASCVAPDFASKGLCGPTGCACACGHCVAPFASSPFASAPVASAPIASTPVASACFASAPVASACFASAPFASAPFASAPWVCVAAGGQPFASAPRPGAVAAPFASTGVVGYTAAGAAGAATVAGSTAPQWLGIPPSAGGA